MRRSITGHCRLLQGLGLLLISGLSPLATAAEAEMPAPDTRRVYTDTAPAWLRAVGKLQVPGHKYQDGRRAHHREDCSATLVAQPASTKADTIITAWHCLEFYSDLSKPITFTLLPGSDQGVGSEAYRVADGGGMHADWAILRLTKAIPADQIAALSIHWERANAGLPITMAGYSRDSGIGNHGERLSFDPGCAITRQVAGSSESNCTAHKGSSGGAVVQLSPLGKAHICGVISQGNGVGLSTFVPVDDFRNAINQHLH
jgi:hypothetical protein